VAAHTKGCLAKIWIAVRGAEYMSIYGSA